MKRPYYEKPEQIDLEDYADLVKRVAGEVFKKINGFGRYEYNDFIQNGWIGLLAAKQNYDYSKREYFDAYAYFCVRGEILNEIRRSDALTFTQRQQSKQIQKAKSELQYLLGRNPTPNEIATKIGIDAKELLRFENNSSEVTIIQIEPTTGDDNKIPVDPPDHRPTQIKLMIDEEIKHQIKIVFSAMNPEIKHIMIDHFINGITFRKIGDSLGLSEFDIGRRAKLGIEQIRKQLSVHGFELDDYLFSSEINIAESVTDVDKSMLDELRSEFGNKNHRKGNRKPRFEAKVIEFMDSALNQLMLTLKKAKRGTRTQMVIDAYEKFRLICVSEALAAPSFKKFNKELLCRQASKKIRITSMPFQEKLAA